MNNNFKFLDKKDPLDRHIIELVKKRELRIGVVELKINYATG